MAAIGGLVNHEYAQPPRHPPPTEGATARYRFQETVRSYASERLAEWDETEPARCAISIGPLVWQSRLLHLCDNGEYARARAVAEEGLELSTALGDRWTVASMVKCLARVAVAEGDVAQEVALHERSLAQHRQVGNGWSIAEGLLSLASALLRLGEAERAAALLHEGLELCRAVGYRHLQPDVLRALGTAARLQGDIEGSRRHLERSLAESRALDDPNGYWPTLDALAATVAADGEPERAVRLLGGAAARVTPAHLQTRTDIKYPVDGLIAALREELGETAFDSTWSRGAAMSTDEALAGATGDRVAALLLSAP